MLKFAHLAIQCKAPNGEHGTFLYEPDTVPFQPVSPIFPGNIELFQWCRENGWEEAGYNVVLTNRGPCGTYMKKVRYVTD